MRSETVTCVGIANDTIQEKKSDLNGIESPCRPLLITFSNESGTKRKSRGREENLYCGVAWQHANNYAKLNKSL